MSHEFPGHDNEDIDRKTAIPHSGRQEGDMHEEPVDPFLNTSLNDAEQKGFMTAPDNVEGGFHKTPLGANEQAFIDQRIAAARDSHVEAPRKKSNAGKIAVGTVAGLALIGGGIAGGIAMTSGNNNETPTEPQPGNEAPVVPGVTEPTVEPTPVATPTPTDLTPVESISPTPTETYTPPAEALVTGEISGLSEIEISDMSAESFNTMSLPSRLESADTIIEAIEPYVDQGLIEKYEHSKDNTPEELAHIVAHGYNLAYGAAFADPSAGKKILSRVVIDPGYVHDHSQDGVEPAEENQFALSPYGSAQNMIDNEIPKNADTPTFLSYISEVVDGTSYTNTSTNNLGETTTTAELTFDATIGANGIGDMYLSGGEATVQVKLVWAEGEGDTEGGWLVYDIVARSTS